MCVNLFFFTFVRKVDWMSQLECMQYKVDPVGGGNL